MSEDEIEMIEDEGNEGEQQVDGDEGAGPFEKKQRKKKSSIWDEMTTVVLDNDTVKVKCNHYKELFAKSATGATSQQKRHLNSCLQLGSKANKSNKCCHSPKPQVMVSLPSQISRMIMPIVLNFCNVHPPYTGVIIADALSKCFIDWGIENKVSSITVDNASYNDRRIKYLNNSESRLLEFAKIKKQLQLPSRKLILNCPTRWNSTYLMLVSGLEFKDIFPRYANINPGFHYIPTDFEWMKVEEVCKFLEIFHEITDMISESEYPTANIFLMELYRIKELLNEKVLDPFKHIWAMAGSMSAKFDKYWGESNVLLSLGAILDPRYKMFLINHAFSVIYGKDAAPRFAVETRDILYELYNEYVDCHIVSHSEQQQRQVVKRRQNKGSSSSSKKQKMTGPAVLTGKEKFHMHVSEIDRDPPEKSDLDIYLEESRYTCDANANLDVLGW
ncbi:zinc finger BED domain-containing protein RICESLEEPER 2-like [Coffea eugenioides]|uniref:zinc finger BED domain-containing protein RICESLEEPER 2-like n=1 Tax=Coffea eugenioides TaxID=49369 RepID=UPI000F613330|nr:zinc finger BED domain-containing protein RICESLEEPER 2-like [Coffea eugenioides]